MRNQYKTSVGTFWIVPSAGEQDKVTLGIDEVTIGTWNSPAEAAQAVWAQNTGWERWDLLFEISGPRDLSEWEDISEE